MKALQRTLRIVMLLPLLAAAMGAGWLVRTAVEFEPAASALEGDSPDGVFDEWRVLDLFHPEVPSGPGEALEPLFGSCAPLLDLESTAPMHQGLETLFDPPSLASEGMVDDEDVHELLNDPPFPGAWSEDEPHALPTHALPSIPVPLEPEDPALPLASLPECGQRPL